MNERDQAMLDEGLAHLQAPFNERELSAWTLAIGLSFELERAVNTGEFSLPDSDRSGLRCHEIARAMGRIVQLPVQDGWVGLFSPTFGGVEHSWLWTKPFPFDGTDEDVLAWDGHILDPRVMGGYPSVQLVSCHPMLSQLSVRYRPSLVPRTDVNFVLVDRLEIFFRAYIEQKIRHRERKKR